MSSRTRSIINSALLISMTIVLAAPAVAQKVGRPNIVLIVTDDMGYADIGAFGGEIETPNMDALAMEGVRFTSFYTHASCSPTRSMLLSGVDTHLNGLGNMSEWTAPNQRGVPGYEGDLNHDVVTLPELLQQSGYHTYMVGKWHLGKSPDHIPAARGFERDFSLLDGGGNYWDMINVTAKSPRLVFTEDGRYLTSLPDDYYATRTYTDKMIDFIESNRGDNKPFFAFVAHQAPHDPYHLPREWRGRHVGQYDKGWDAVRNERLSRQKALGIVPEDAQLAERLWFLPDPSTLAAMPRALLGKKMELYADMVINLDHHIGRLVDYLKDVGEYENTIFIVFGDNGAEGTDLFAMIAGTPGTNDFLWAALNWSQTDPNAWGDPGSFVGYGPMWAQVSMTPFSQYKGWMAEGGIRNALIVSGPIVNRAPGSINHGFMHVADIVPTLLDVAGASYPATRNGRPVPPMIGKSWSHVLSGDAESPRDENDYMGWELFGNRAIRQGDWKLRWQWRPFGTGDWELYDLANDSAERSNLADDRPEKLEQMLGLWEEYATANNVIVPSRSVFESLEDQLPPRVPDDPGFPPLIYKGQFVPPEDMTAPPK